MHRLAAHRQLGIVPRVNQLEILHEDAERAVIRRDRAYGWWGTVVSGCQGGAAEWLEGWWRWWEVGVVEVVMMVMVPNCD